jgi:hypothetical protein
VVQRGFDAVIGAEAVRFSHGQFCFVVESFDDSGLSIGALKPASDRRFKTSQRGVVVRILGDD